MRYFRYILTISKIFHTKLVYLYLIHSTSHSKMKSPDKDCLELNANYRSQQTDSTTQQLQISISNFIEIP